MRAEIRTTVTVEEISTEEAEGLCEIQYSMFKSSGDTGGYVGTERVVTRPSEPGLPAQLVTFSVTADVHVLEGDGSVGMIELLPEGDFESIRITYMARRHQNNLMDDTALLFERFVTESIMKPPSEEPHGYAVLRILDLKQRLNNVWRILGVLTLGASALLGAPMWSEVAEIEVELDILDSQRSLLARYSGSGRGEAYTAMYWGYWNWQPDDAKRVANSKALSAAMAALARQLKQDSVGVWQRLQGVGAPGVGGQ